MEHLITSPWVRVVGLETETVLRSDLKAPQAGAAQGPSGRGGGHRCTPPGLLFHFGLRVLERNAKELKAKTTDCHRAADADGLARTGRRLGGARDAARQGARPAVQSAGGAAAVASPSTRTLAIN